MRLSAKTLEILGVSKALLRFAEAGGAVMFRSRYVPPGKWSARRVLRNVIYPTQICDREVA